MIAYGWIIAGIIIYWHGSNNRIKQKHYQAWQTINFAQGKTGSGGRIQALQELNEDGVSLLELMPLPITDELLEILKRQGRSISGFVFVNQHGRHYTAKINVIWKEAYKKAGVNINLYNSTPQFREPKGK